MFKGSIKQRLNSLSGCDKTPKKLKSDSEKKELNFHIIV